MTSSDLDTAALLGRWRSGDPAALDALIEQDLPWIRARVRERLGPLLRARAETEDFVQEAMVELLRYGPRVTLAGRESFRALAAIVIENVLRNQHDRFTALKRATRRERPLPLPDLGPAVSTPRPSEGADRAEWEDLIHLALEVLAPDDREVLLLREWDGLSFEEVGRRIGASSDAARMRFHRALARLAAAVQRVRTEGIGPLLDGMAGAT